MVNMQLKLMTLTNSYGSWRNETTFFRIGVKLTETFFEMDLW